ncbi:ABC transporter ATP-binding protein [Acidisoma sp. C75]
MTAVAAAPASAPSPREAAVVAEKLSIRFGEGAGATLALSEIDLVVPQGAFVSLIGPSGCGKTTLLRAIADLVQPSGGLLRVQGMTPGAARLARAYGYVFQAPALLPWRTVLRNVTLPLEIMGLGRAEREREARRHLDLVGLADVARKFPWQLSGGMQQRVSIARALSFEPSLLLMDEPFGALDEITRDGLNLHLHELWTRTGLTGVFVTHSIPEAVFLSTHIVVMSARPGRIVEIIESDLPLARRLEDRESPGFIALSKRVREALHIGYAHV